MIVSGAKGEYVGSQDYLMEKLNLVKDVMNQYNDDLGRIKLKLQIIENEKIAEKYLDAFSIHDTLYLSDLSHKECVKYIKACLASIVNEKEAYKLVQRYNDKGERLKLKDEIKNDKEITQKYIEMFKMLKKDMELNKEQKKCLSFIKFFGKKI